ARGERPGLPAEEGYIPRGLRFTGHAPRSGAARAVDLLVKRLKGEPFETEWPVPAPDRVPPPPPVRDLARATIAVVTSAGIVPLDVLRELEAAGAIGRLLDTFYVTVGSGASQASAPGCPPPSSPRSCPWPRTSAPTASSPAGRSPIRWASRRWAQPPRR